MYTGNTFLFIIIDIIVAAVFCVAVANGLKSGASRMIMDFLTSVGKIIIAGFGGYSLMKVFNPIPADKISDFLLNQLNTNLETNASDQAGAAGLPPEQVEFVCKLLCVIIYFVLFMIILSAIERTLMKRQREKQGSEGKKRSLLDTIAGGLLGFMLFVVCTALPSPALISAQANGVIPNGKDLVYKSFLAFPVNLVARPLTRLAAGEETDKSLWEEKGYVIPLDEIQDIKDQMGESGDTQ